MLRKTYKQIYKLPIYLKSNTYLGYVSTYLYTYGNI